MLTLSTLLIYNGMFTLSTFKYIMFVMKEYHHGNLKQQLLDEGLKLLTEEGYDKFSLRKLARRCNVSHTSPYRHFSDKNELIMAISKEIQDKFNIALISALKETSGSQEDKVKAMGRKYVHFFLENPDYLEVLFLTPELQEISKDKHDHCDGSSFETYMTAVLPLLSDGKTENIPIDYEALDGRIPGAALKPWCLIHGLTVLLVKKPSPLQTGKALINLYMKFLNKRMRGNQANFILSDSTS